MLDHIVCCKFVLGHIVCCTFVLGRIVCCTFVLGYIVCCTFVLGRTVCCTFVLGFIVCRTFVLGYIICCTFVLGYIVCCTFVADFLCHRQRLRHKVCQTRRRHVGVCVDGCGDLVVQDSSRLYIYSRQQGATHQLKTIDTRGEEYRYIAISRDNVFCQKKWGSNKTIKYSRHDCKNTILTHIPGFLIGCFHPDAVAYAHRNHHNHRRRYISIKFPERTLTLVPAGGSWPDVGLSVCFVSARIVVTSWKNQTLDTFSLEGEI